VLLLRILAILTLCCVGGGVLGYCLSGRQRYLRFAWQTFRLAVVVALVIFGLLLLERFAVIAL